MWQAINMEPSSVLEVMHVKQSCAVVSIVCAESLQSLQQSWPIFMGTLPLLTQIESCRSAGQCLFLFRLHVAGPQLLA